VLVNRLWSYCILVILAARRAGAAQESNRHRHQMKPVLANYARQCGADVTLKHGGRTRWPGPLTANGQKRDRLDVASYECSGAQTCPDLWQSATLRPRARIVAAWPCQADMSLPMMMIRHASCPLMGIIPLHDAFCAGVKMMQDGLINTAPLLTHSFSLARLRRGICQTANDRTQRA